MSSTETYTISRCDQFYGKAVLFFVGLLAILFLFTAGVLTSAVAIIKLRERPFYSKDLMRSDVSAIAFTITPQNFDAGKSERVDSIKRLLSGYETSPDESVKRNNMYRFDAASLGPCGIYPYGYNVSRPCIYFKLNKILDWKPASHDRNSLSPSTMPERLRNIILSTYYNKTYVSCNGESPADRSRIAAINYYPDQEAELYRLPYTGESEYRSPVMAVEIVSNQRSVRIDLACFVWLRDDLVINRKYKLYV